MDRGEGPTTRWGYINIYLTAVYKQNFAHRTGSRSHISPGLLAKRRLLMHVITSELTCHMLDIQHRIRYHPHPESLELWVSLKMCVWVSSDPVSLGTVSEVNHTTVINESRT